MLLIVFAVVQIIRKICSSQEIELDLIESPDIHSRCGEELNLESLWNMNLTDVAAQTQYISLKHKQLIDDGILVFEDMITEDGLKLFDKAYSLSEPYSETIYSKITIYPFDCPIEQQNARVSWIEQYNNKSFLWSHKLVGSYSEYFEKIYHYQPLRTLLSSIILNDYHKSGSLNYVYDKDNHLYFHTQRGYPHNESTPWHFDEHHFSCVILLKQSQFGGNFNYIQYRNTTRTTNNRITFFDNYWNDEKLENLINLSKNSGITMDKHQHIMQHHQSHIFSVLPGRGDVYCFFGNESLHSVTQITGDDARISIVFSMAFGEQFDHSGGAKTSLQTNDSYTDPQIESITETQVLS